MGRRSDHSRAELREMIIAEGHRQMNETGYARFSAREVAKRIGYSIGTIYNVFGSYDRLILAINGRTLDMWRRMLEARLSAGSADPLRAGIEAYFDFALQNRHAWTAVFDFRLPEGEETPEDYQVQVRSIMEVTVRLLTEILPADQSERARALAPSLLAIVHGHCFFKLNRTFDILGETSGLEACLARVRAALAEV